MRNFSAIVALALAACLAMATIGCSGGDYEKARSLYDSGQFEEAAAIFEKLGDYEDSADMYLKCEYDHAKELYESERYEKAEALFAQLGDYEDSAEMVGDCERGITLRDYGDVLKGLKGEWYINGGSNANLLCYSFNSSKVTIFDIRNDQSDGDAFMGNAQYTKTVCDVRVDDSDITILKEGRPFKAIKYSMSDGSVVLDGGAYMPGDRARKELEGVWSGTVSEDTYLGVSTKHVTFDLSDGTLKFEERVSALNKPGDYYEYGPSEFKYELDGGLLKLDTSQRTTVDTADMGAAHARFNVIDGKATLLYGGTPLSRE